MWNFVTTALLLKPPKTPQMLKRTYSFVGCIIQDAASQSSNIHKAHSQLQSSKRQFQSSCRVGWCGILRKLLQKISIFEKHMELMLPASFTLLNHLQPWHTNIATCLCQWLHRSEGQMISQLHCYPVCAHKQAQPKPRSNKQSETNHLQQKNNTVKLFTSSLICA